MKQWRLNGSPIIVNSHFKPFKYLEHCPIAPNSLSKKIVSMEYCCLENQDKGAFFSITINPDLDLLVSLSPATST